MPYLAFQTSTGAKVEIGGNSPAQFEANIAKNGTVAHPELALAFVKAFFIRRDLHVKKQKALQVEDEDAADAADEELEPAEAEETRAKEAYLAACAGKGPSAAASSSAAAAPAAADDPYAFLKAPAAAPQPPADDDFM